MTAPNMLRLLYFGWLRERVGTMEESVPFPEGVTTISDLLAWQGRRGPVHAAAFADTARIRCAINQEFVQRTASVRPDDEIAFFPPVTGG
jgi:sulfur-carrier protein